MNAMDMRVLGASALTAAIVSVSIGFVMARRDCPTVVAIPAAAPVPVSAAPAEAPVVEVADEEIQLIDEVDENDDVSIDDCEALKEKGMNHINMGQHAAALTAFEASLACNDDPYVRQLAFMESCASGNSLKAKLFYRKLTPSQQTKFAQICIRQRPFVPYE